MERRQFLQLSAAITAALSAPRVARAATNETHLERPATRWRPRLGIRKPNIVIAVLDDVGFGDLGCYGAEHKTAAIDAIAANGVRFNNFHVTALCAPTRACLLTGRNAHAVGVGNIAEWGRDHPGYHGWIRKDAATLAEYLRPDAYTTLATGKWHLSAIHDQNGSGPFEHWPVGRGFDRWYGFHGNAMDHWHPEMFENTVAAYPDKGDDYHLSNDLVDRSIDYIEDHLAATPENPFFLYLAFGACHFPLHAPADDIRRHQGKYDQGWDAVRQQRFERQRELGIIPDDARLAPRNPNVPAWSSLSTKQKQLAVRGQEVYAAFLEHTDAQLARLITFLKAENELDDTILVVLSDNGAPGSGDSAAGILDVRRNAYYEEETLAELSERFDALGSDDSYGLYSSGWAQASNTPLKWYKSDTYGGGTRAPLIVSWPNGQIGSGRINDQYHHIIDLVPSLFEMINKPAPAELDQNIVLPLQGTSFAYAFDNPDSPTHKRVQYFETSGDRAIWKDGWKAVTRHTTGDKYASDVWELYRTEHDFSEIDNRADEHPRRLEHLVELWHREAERDNVLPMEDDLFKLYKEVVPKPRRRYTFYPGMTRLDRLSAPDLHSYSGTITAQVAIQNQRANGVILASGDSGAGYELFMQDGLLAFVYVYTRFERYSVRSENRIARGTRSLSIRFEKTGENSANVHLLADDKHIASLTLPKMWQIFSPNSGVRCGENRHAPISRDYESPFVFDQTLERVVVELDLPKTGV